MLAALPQVLTVTNWNANKGVIAKMAGATGITNALAALKTEWDKVDWRDLDPQAAAGKAGGQTTYALLQRLHGTAQGDYAKIKPVMDELKKVRDITKQTADQWRTSKTIPASSRKHVDEMAQAADKLAISLRTLDADWVKQLKARKQLDDQMLAGALQLIRPALKDVRDQAPNVHTAADWGGTQGRGFRQSMRALSAALGASKSPPLVDWNVRKLSPKTTDAYVPKNDNEVAGKVREVLTALGELDHLLA